MLTTLQRLQLNGLPPHVAQGSNYQFQRDLEAIIFDTPNIEVWDRQGFLSMLQGLKQRTLDDFSPLKIDTTKTSTLFQVKGDFSDHPSALLDLDREEQFIDLVMEDFLSPGFRSYFYLLGQDLGYIHFTKAHKTHRALLGTTPPSKARVVINGPGMNLFNGLLLALQGSEVLMREPDEHSFKWLNLHLKSLGSFSETLGCAAKKITLTTDITPGTSAGADVSYWINPSYNTILNGQEYFARDLKPSGRLFIQHDLELTSVFHSNLQLRHTQYATRPLRWPVFHTQTHYHTKISVFMR